MPCDEAIGTHTTSKKTLKLRHISGIRQPPTSKTEIMKSLLQARTSVQIYPRKLVRYLSSCTSSNQEYDVLIVGGGVTGLAFAHRLTQSWAHNLRIGILSTSSTPNQKCNHFDYDGNSMIPNPRAYALSPSSLNTLGSNVTNKLYKWRRMAEYSRMQIWESNGPAVLQFTHRDLQNDYFNSSFNNYYKSKNESDSICLGAVVEDEAIVLALTGALKDKESVDLISDSVVTKVNQTLSQNESNSIKIGYKQKDDDDTSNHKELSAKLLVAADGGNSFIRNSLGMPTIGFGYNRKAIICTVKLQENKSLVSAAAAFQIFFPNGPIALLPTQDPNFGNIVWSTTPSEALRLTQCRNEDFVQELNQCLQRGPTLSPPLFRNADDYYNKLPSFVSGALKDIENVGQSIGSGLALLAGSSNGPETFQFPPMIQSVESRRFSFDLKLQHAQQYVGPRVALIGDAAHTIHPMAGQGLNLGLADVEALTKYVRLAQDSGTDIGASRYLRMYESERQKAALAMMGGIQFLHGAFSTEFAPIVYFRSIGMNFVNAATPIRQLLANVAAGNAGASIENHVP